MSSQTQDWFAHWYGNNVDEVLKQFKLENLYACIESLPEGSITTTDYNPNRCTIYYDPQTCRVTLITTG